jgi:hypothetical protein
VGDVADGGDQGWVGHDGARAEQRAPDGPHGEGIPEGDDEQAGGLRELTAGDEPPTSDAV